MSTTANAPMLISTTKSVTRIPVENEPYTPISFSEVNQRANALANLIESKHEELCDILLSYESFEVVQDEMARTLDLLRSLKENEKFFRLRVNEVTAFLPRNQPLYAFTCFVIVPALMASEVHFRIPHSMRHFFPQILSLLDIHHTFPNIVVSNLTRLEFLRKRSALRVNDVTGESLPVTDAVIFTGTSVHASQLRHIFDTRTLFISNGAGHNPVVVSSDADISSAADAVLELQLYNQGQDCAAPNSVLVHKDVFVLFRETLRKKLKDVKVGGYRDRTSRVGPISDPQDLVRILDFIIRNQEYIDETTKGTIRASEAILEPTLICKSLKAGGNYTEIFAPVIFLQEYKEDSQLAHYFEDLRYAQNAMYVTLYGTSDYILGLENREIGGKVLHDSASILRNTHLHVNGVERGTQPYGGLGYGASSLSINAKIICKPTLPQRDIYEWVAKPLFQKGSLEEYRKNIREFKKISYKNIEKLLKMTSHEPEKQSDKIETSVTYIDTHVIKNKKNQRFAKVDEEHQYRLMERQNLEYMASLKPADITQIRTLRQLLRRRKTLSHDEFSTLLYALPIKAGGSKRENRMRQLQFFQHVYQLLLGKKFGPRLSFFLTEVDLKKIRALLDV